MRRVCVAVFSETGVVSRTIAILVGLLAVSAARERKGRRVDDRQQRRPSVAFDDESIRARALHGKPPFVVARWRIATFPSIVGRAAGTTVIEASC
jgi:hypothetical protein